jgi:hypothetical protein
MGRGLLFLCGLAACASPLPEAAAQKPLAPSGAYNVLAVEQTVLLARRNDLLKDLARYKDKVRDYTARHQRNAQAVAEMSLTHGPRGRWAHDQRAQRLALLRHEADGLRREHDRLEVERKDLSGKLQAVAGALVRVQAAMAALKGVSAPPE